MKKIAFIVAAASLYALAPIAGRLGPVGSSALLVWLGVVVAVTASGGVSALAIAGGALGAFGSGILGTASPAAAGAVLLAAAFAERTTRVRSRNARALHVLLALGAGALAGSLSTAFTASSLPVLVVAIVVAAVLAAMPLLVEADDPTAHALDLAANDVAEPAKAALRRGAELRRAAEHVPLDRTLEERVRKTWQSLLRLAEARMRLERSRPPALLQLAEVASPTAGDTVLAMVDQKIEEHVAVLARAIAAVDTAHAAALGLDDSALKNAESMGDSLEEVSRAMVDVG